MTTLDDAFKANQKLWDTYTKLHMDSDFYDLEGFKKNSNSLRIPEQEALSNVQGKSLCHLQCHFGQDTISWAKKGAQITGIDLSQEAIHQANELAKQMNVEANFVQGNVLEASTLVKGQFDIVFTSYGSVLWLNDIDLWAEQVNALLKPGGTFYMVDFHPVFWIFDPTTGNIREPYFFPGIQKEIAKESYTGTELETPMPEYYWNHPLSSIITALAKAGLRIRDVQEFNYSSYKIGDDFTEIGMHKYQLKSLKNNIPYMYSIEAIK